MTERPALNLVRKLCKALDVEKVAYCHWKSNVALDRSASGENDLDLLVDRADVRLFTEILYRMGFKEARVSSRQCMPAVLDYYGYDEDADKLVHVHAHYQLVLGDDMTKNYRVPIERPFIESATQDEIFRIPAPDFEFILFVIRMVLKHSTWDALVSGQSTLPLTARQELMYLRGRIDHTRVYHILKQHLPHVDRALFERCVQSLEAECPIWTRIKTARQLVSALRAHARRSRVSDTFLKFWRRGIRVMGRLIVGHLARKRMAHGGAMIAVVGGDEAGESVVIDRLYGWLSKDFATLKVHIGKPPPSWTTMAVRGILGLGGLLRFLPFRRSLIRDTGGRSYGNFAGYPLLLREVCTARDRYRAYRRGRRFATNGGLLISDRYPISQIKTMDGSQLGEIRGAGRTNALVAFLLKAGRRYYHHIMAPEVVIVLRVDPEIAVQRATGENGASVLACCQEMWNVDWRATGTHVIDACRTRGEVLSDVKSLLWAKL